MSAYNVANPFDGCVQFTTADHEYSPKELQQLALIAEKFRLFYDNIGSEIEAQTTTEA